jgi:glycosyltransferase involved in cell wall biosynthesis
MKPEKEKPISICFVSPKAYGLFEPTVKTNFGGAEVDMYMLATELAKDPAFAVTFLVADYGQPAEELRENVRLLKSLDWRQNPLSGAAKIWKTLKRADTQFYLCKTASPGVPLVYTFCRLHRRRFLYRTAHRHECDGTYRAEHPIWGRLFYWALRGAARVFAQNEEDSRLLKETAHVEAEVIANGHRLRQCWTEPRKYILWVGRSAQFKHPERFLELARRCIQEQFVIVCRPAAGDRNYEVLQKEAATIGNLTFYSDVDFFELDRFFAAAKVFVNTSDAEGFPNTFIQAAAAGTAILSWQVNPDGFLTRWQCGLACGGTMERLTEGLRFLLEQDRYIEIGQNGLRYVRQHHDISVLVERYKESLRKCLKEPSVKKEA